MQRIEEAYKDIFQKDQQLEKVNDIKRRLLVFFKQSNMSARQWSKVIGVHHDTFQSFFLTTGHNAPTIKRFEDALHKLEKKDNIDKIL